jgi:hypothetical protein
VGRPEWRPERGITDSAVEAQAQAMISQPQRVSWQPWGQVADCLRLCAGDAGHRAHSRLLGLIVRAALVADLAKSAALAGEADQERVSDSQAARGAGT